MCGDGVGSANNEDNDDEQDSGNSFTETLANIFTPGDGMSYVDGQLTENNKSRDQQFYDTSNKSDDGPGYANIMVGGKQKQIRRDANNKYKQRYASALMGAASGGIPGILGSLAANELTKGKTGAGVLGVGESAGDAVGSLKGFFAAPEFDTPEEEADYKAQQAARVQAQMNSNNDIFPDVGNNVVAPTVTLPGVTMPANSAMSDAAAQGGFKPVPNPDYDPNDPMSQKFLSNPSYAQLLAYQNSGQVPGMAMGGMAQIGMGFPGGPPMPRAAGPYGQTGSLMGRNPLQQYGGYLEQQYGDAGFDQKKDRFLQEVLQKEQQTFSGGGLANLMGGGPQPTDFDYQESLISQQPPLMNYGAENLGGMNFPPEMQGAAGPITSFAEGGEVGGNEKTAISDAISAVKGQMPEEQAAIALGMFVQNYGEEALKNLVERVQSGEFDDTVDRFANGEAGAVVGPGDGSGVDDKVPASLEGQQDVLLADGEFVLRKKTADALEKKYGGGFLDTVNEAEDNAPRTMQEYMARA